MLEESDISSHVDSGHFSRRIQVKSRYNEAVKILLANHSSYPRIGDTSELQQLRRTIAARERQEATPEALRAAEDNLVRAALTEQEEAGLDLVTDGQVRWADPISHLAGKLEGIEINGLLRFFDTNFYFRQPVASGEIRARNGLIASEFAFARLASSKPVKPVLTGPYTLARHTIAAHAPYKRLEQLARAYAEVLAKELEALAHAGAEVIQLEEPSVLRHPADFPILARSFERLSQHKGKAKLLLAVYWGDAQPLYQQLQELPVDGLGLDFTYNPRLVEQLVALGVKKWLALGLLDARNTRLEDPGAVARQLERILPRVTGEVCYLTPSCGLEYLPRDRAQKKLHLLAEIRSRLQGQG